MNQYKVGDVDEVDLDRGGDPNRGPAAKCPERFSVNRFGRILGCQANPPGAVDILDRSQCR